MNPDEDAFTWRFSHQIKTMNFLLQQKLSRYHIITLIDLDHRKFSIATFPQDIKIKGISPDL
tara:strand:- start:152 stop:337 length:186 start_codon:yes stop_codon:yes gene_type:complete